MKKLLLLTILSVFILFCAVFALVGSYYLLSERYDTTFRFYLCWDLATRGMLWVMVAMSSLVVILLSSVFRQNLTHPVPVRVLGLLVILATLPSCTEVVDTIAQPINYAQPETRYVPQLLTLYKKDADLVKRNDTLMLGGMPYRILCKSASRCTWDNAKITK